MPPVPAFPCPCRRREIRPSEAADFHATMPCPEENGSPPHLPYDPPRTRLRRIMGEGGVNIIRYRGGAAASQSADPHPKASLGATNQAALNCFA